MADLPEHLRSETLDMSSLASDDQLARARSLATELVSVDQSIEVLKTRLEELSARRADLAHREIPEFFGQISTDKIGVPEAGVDVVVVPYCKAGIAASWEPERKESAYSWLEENGHGSIVAVEVSVSFSRGELEEARQLQELIRTTFPGSNNHPVEFSMSVPWQTLTSLVRERIEAGDSVPLETLGATVGQVAKIKKRSR